MDRRIRGPRLGKADIEGLLKSHVKLVKVDEMLQHTNWAGGPACRVLCGEVDVVIAQLYNKAERAMTRAPEGQADAIAVAAPATPEEVKPE